MQTSIAKTKSGWQGNTRIDLGGDRILRIVTVKDRDGALVTSAWVHRVVNEIGYRAEIHDARSDYARRMIHWVVRVTEKQVRAQHQLALDMVDEMLPVIAKHYGVDGS